MSNQAWQTAANALLVKGAWFSGIPEELRAEILNRSELIRLDTDDFLFCAGDAVDGFYCVLSGDMRSFRRDADGKDAFLEIFGPNSWVGVVLSIDCCPKRDFGVVAASPSRAIFVPTAAYREIVGQTPSHIEWFGRLICSLAAETREAMFEHRFNATRRTARMLLRIADLHGRESANGIELPIGLSQGDLASLVGVSRQYMNGLIKQWQREGLVYWSGQSFPIVVPERLVSLLQPLNG